MVLKLENGVISGAKEMIEDKMRDNGFCFVFLCRWMIKMKGAWQWWMGDESLKYGEAKKIMVMCVFVDL